MPEAHYAGSRFKSGHEPAFVASGAPAGGSAPPEQIRNYLDDSVLPLDIVRGVYALLDVAQAARRLAIETRMLIDVASTDYGMTPTTARDAVQLVEVALGKIPQNGMSDSRLITDTPTKSDSVSSGLVAIRERWRGVYAVDGAHKVGPDELPPDIAALLDVAEAALDVISECQLAPDSPLPDGRSWCVAHQDWDYASGPHCAMAELKVALGKIPQHCEGES